MIGVHTLALGLSLPAINVPVLGLIVAALWGASDFLGGLATRKAGTFLAVAIAHSLSLVALILIATGVHAHFPSERTAIWAVITGLSGGAALMVFYRALAVGEMGLTAALTGMLTAAVPVAFSWFTEGRPKNSQLIGFVIAIVAICLIAYEPRGRPRLRGLGLATIAGLGFGAFLIASKFASQGAVLWPLAYSRLTSASLAWAILLTLRMRRAPGLPPGGLWCPGPSQSKDWIRSVLLLAGASGILEAAGNLIYMFTTLIARLDVAAVLASLYPACTILLAVWLLKERATRGKALGMALALVSVVVISL